jgi:hypothetical protein
MVTRVVQRLWAIAHPMTWMMRGSVSVDINTLRIILSCLHQARKSGFAMVAGAPASVLVFEMIWAGGLEVSSRKPYAS